MSILYPALGAAIAVAGGDKLVDEGSYRGMFRGLGWSRGQMQSVAVVELVGGLLMGSRATRRLGGAIVAAASGVVLSSELRRGDGKLAFARALVLVAGLCALAAPGR